MTENNLGKFFGCHSLQLSRVGPGRDPPTPARRLSRERLPDVGVSGLGAPAVIHWVLPGPGSKGGFPDLKGLPGRVSL